MAKAEDRRTKLRAAASGEAVVVIGAGLAGLYTALKLAPRPVIVVSGAPFGEGGSSFWAQAGVAAAMGEGDSPQAHAADTVAAGAGLVDETIALAMAAEAPERVAELLDYGVPFDRDAQGRLTMSREAAHRRGRILHVQGDRAGAAIMAAITKAVRQTPSITVMDGWNAGDLVLDDAGRVAGITLWPVAGGAPLSIPTRAVVLATGGLGQLFAVTTNPAPARGEGVAIAARAGALIADPEFVQFHPTAINVGADPAPLATEALRGEGAVLIDGTGKRFMRGIHPDAELAPRDIVARGVHREVVSGRGAFLDCRAVKDFANRFPTVYAASRKAGIDPAREPIPVAPAAHYAMGGILTDDHGRTSIQGLWACGEVASTGVHGANRLASNSLLEAVVFGARVAADIAATPLPAAASLTAQPDHRDEAMHAPNAAAMQRLRTLMSSHVGVVRDAASLAQALSVIGELEAAGPDRQFANMLTTAKLIAAGAYARKESRGAHFRSDYPESSTQVPQHTRLTLAEANAIAEAARDETGKRPAVAAHAS